MRATRAEVDLDAIAHNVSLLAETVAPARLCAVVKADGYGHGAIAVGQAALEAGAEWLAVAMVEEASVLRRSGVSAPILLLSEPRTSDVPAALERDVRLTVYSKLAIAEAAMAARDLDIVAKLHLKVDTGMHRVGCRADEVVALARHIERTDNVELEAIWTHCAVADEPGNPFTDVQLRRLAEAVSALEAEGLRPPLVHAANSAAGIDRPDARLDMVRAGIVVYGLDPSPGLAGRQPLLPALSLLSQVSHVEEVQAGEAISYGRRHVLEHDTVIATIPIGYADGVPRALSRAGGCVLIRGRRRPMVGVVTMDQVMVDCGPVGDVSQGDDVVLIGYQGDEYIGASEWASLLDTIPYEVVCGIGPRVPRVYVGGPVRIDPLDGVRSVG